MSLTIWEDVGVPALRALVASAQGGYADLEHAMWFRRADGFSSPDELQTGDVFQRAVVLETLSLAQRAGLVACQEILDDGVEYLTRVRRPGDVGDFGGWSYFPGLPELAPDVDTLAQVLKVFMLNGRYDLIERLVQPTLDHVEATAGPDGLCETWIVQEQSPLAGLQSWWAANAWGTGADTEVVANLLHALAHLDARRYGDWIARGKQALLARTSDGLWESTWYHGPLYGTFVCTRVLCGVPAATLTRVCASQRPDGGWGLSPDAPSDPLSTALALLTLGAAPHCQPLDVREAPNSRSEDVRGAPNPQPLPPRTGAGLGVGAPSRLAVGASLARGRAFLLDLSHTNRLVVAVPFIKMNVGRARGLPGPILSFGSPTLTAAYVALAALPR